MHRRGLGFWAVSLAVAGMAAAAGEAPLRMTIPRVSRPPALDGTIAAGEWDDAAAVSGVINQFDGVAHPRPATFWVKCDGTNVYVAQRSTLLPGELQEAPRRQPLRFPDNDNLIAICLAPGRKNSGELPSHYQFTANVNGKTWSQEVCWQRDGIKWVYPQNDTWKGHWTATNSLNAAQTVWEGEYSLPLAAMKVDAVTDGEEWGLFFARDYPCGDQNGIVLSRDWRFGPANRHWGLGLYDNYRLEGAYARARVSATEPVVQVLRLGDLAAGMLDGHLRLFNPAVAAAKLTILCTVTTLRGREAHRQELALDLPPGARQDVALGPQKLPPGRDLRLLIEVRDAAGTVLHRQDLPCRPGYGADRLAHVPDVYFSGAHKEGPFLGAIMPVYNPIRNLLIAKVSLDRLPARAQAARAEVTVRRPGETRPFFTMPLPAFGPNGSSEHRQALPELEPGLYEATACVYSTNDALLGRARELFIRYDHARDLPWIGNRIGVTEELLPPFEAIRELRNAERGTPSGEETGQDGGSAVRIPNSAFRVFHCWGREYRVNGSGLFDGVATLGQEVLAAPIGLELTTGGKTMALVPGTLGGVDVEPKEAAWTGRLAGGGVTVTCQARMEYDGYVQYRITLDPRGRQGVDRLRLVIPLNPAEATHLHAAAGVNMRAATTSMALKPEPGPLWHSGQSADTNYNGAGLTVGNFKPFVWVGNAHRGLAFMADNDRGWVPDETKAVPAIEVVRGEVSGVRVQVSGGEPRAPETRDGTPDTAPPVCLILNLIARPFVLEHPREIVFSLQATPVRPLPDDFRARRIHIGGGMAFTGGDPDGKSWDGTQLFNNRRVIYSNPYPLDWKKNAEFTALRRPDNPENPSVEKFVATPYQCLNAWLDPAEIDDPRAPGLQGANLYGYICHDVTASWEWGDGVLTPSDLEYRLWRYQRWIRESKLQGMYFDNAYPSLGTTVEAGQGYVLDLPDRPALHGKVQPGYALTGMREFFKRLRAVFAQEGVKDPYVWIHATDTFTISAYAFADFMMDGENGPYITPDYPSFCQRWPPEHMQTTSPSAKWGVSALHMEMLGPGWPPMHLSPATRAAFRDLIGYTMLHDSEGLSYHYGWPGGLDLARKAEYLPYWDPPVAAALAAADTNVYVSAWRQDNGLMVLPFNRGATACTGLALRVDAGALGIVPETGAVLTVVDIEAGAPETELRGAGQGPMAFSGVYPAMLITLDIRPRNYRVLSLRWARP